MTRAGQAQHAVLVVEQAIDHRDERTLRQALVDQVLVQPAEHLVGRHQAVLMAEDLFRPHSLFDEDRQEAGGDAVAHGVGDVEADMVLVEAEGVVEVAADPAAEQVVDGKAAVRDLGQCLREEARLQPLGQLQLLIDLLISLV